MACGTSHSPSVDSTSSRASPRTDARSASRSRSSGPDEPRLAVSWTGSKVLREHARRAADIRGRPHARGDGHDRYSFEYPTLAFLSSADPPRRRLLTRSRISGSARWSGTTRHGSVARRGALDLGAGALHENAREGHRAADLEPARTSSWPMRFWDPFDIAMFVEGVYVQGVQALASLIARSKGLCTPSLHGGGVVPNRRPGRPAARPRGRVPGRQAQAGELRGAILGAFGGRAAAGTGVFLVLAPGVVAGPVPWLLTGWGGRGRPGTGSAASSAGPDRRRSRRPARGVRAVRSGGARHTAPVAPTEHLVVGAVPLRAEPDVPRTGH